MVIFAFSNPYMKAQLPGILFSALIGLLSMWIAPMIPMANSIVVALFIGIVIANVSTTPKVLESGIKFSSKNILEFAIIFLGFGISFQDIANLGWHIVGVLVGTIVVVLLVTLYLTKMFTCRASTGYLVGFGTAICGSSAIAALAPKISQNKNDAGIAIAVINLYGLIGMILLPLFFHSEMLFDTAALLIGGTLHGVSNVAGAGYAINEVVGDLAITIKLGRVALLAPALIFFNFLINREASILDNLKLPYYIIGFIAATATVTFFSVSPDIISLFRYLGKLFLTIAMAAIGLNIHLSHLYSEGKVALGFGAVIFIVQILAVSLFAFFI
jgi:uncharacterized integral membrane protein (TIGR00698 family)